MLARTPATTHARSGTTMCKCRRLMAVRPCSSSCKYCSSQGSSCTPASPHRPSLASSSSERRRGASAVAHAWRATTCSHSPALPARSLLSAACSRAQDAAMYRCTGAHASVHLDVAGRQAWELDMRAASPAAQGPCPWCRLRGRARLRGHTRLAGCRLISKGQPCMNLIEPPVCCLLKGRLVSRGLSSVRRDLRHMDR